MKGRTRLKKIPVPEDLIPYLEWMLSELENNQLKVTLAGEGENKSRVVDSQNAEWYQEFCANHLKERKRPRTKDHPDTKIDRQDTIYRLKTMIKKKVSWSSYAEELFDIAREIKNRMESAYYGGKGYY